MTEQLIAIELHDELVIPRLALGSTISIPAVTLTNDSQELLIHTTALPIAITEPESAAAIELANFFRGPPGDPGTTATITLTAATIIPGHRAIMIDANGNAALADATSPTFVFAGISTTGANAGGLVNVAQSGLIEEPTWNFTPLAPIFVGSNGLLTQTPPSSGVSQIVAVARTATSIMIAPQSPISRTSFEFTQATPASTWTIVHNLGRHPVVNVVNSAGDFILADMAFPSVNVVVVTFSAPTSGSVYLS